MLNSARSDLEGCRIKLREVDAENLTIALNEQLLKQAEAQVQSDRNNLSIARDNLGYTKVYAPMDGVVSAGHARSEAGGLYMMRRIGS